MTDLRMLILAFLLAEHERCRVPLTWKPGDDRRAAAAARGDHNDERVVGVRWNTARATGDGSNAVAKAAGRELAVMEAAGLVLRFAPYGRLTRVKLTPEGEAAARALRGKVR